MAISTNDYEAGSSKYVLTIPAYKKIRAISIGVVITIALLAAGFGALFYARKKWCFEYLQSSGKSEKPGN